MFEEPEEKGLPSSQATAYEEGRMLSPEDVERILELAQQGEPIKAISRRLRISRNTVKRYLRQGCWQPRKPSAVPIKALAGLEEWLEQQFVQHRGNAAVIHQELKKQHDIELALRTVQRAVKPLRDAEIHRRKLTVRFETPPGKQMQVDFGERRVQVAGDSLKVHFAVATLGYSRRCYVEAFPHERQLNWLRAIENALHHFGGVPRQILVDNARALVLRHDTQQELVEFHPTFLDFCNFWGMQPRACRPYRARTKGKVENGVGYVKHNAIAGHEFESFEQLQQHLRWWMDNIADTRIHGTTGEVPLERFEKERQQLGPLPAGRLYPLQLLASRQVQVDRCVQVETNHYSVPPHLVGKSVSVRMDSEQLSIYFGTTLVAQHQRCMERHQWCILPQHRIRSASKEQETGLKEAPGVLSSSLQRPLEEYAQLVEQLGGQP